MEQCLPPDGIRIIGVLESCFQEKFGTPRQPQLVPGAYAKLKIKPEYHPEHSLCGLSGFSHVWLLFWFHLATNKSFRPKIHPPRLKGGKMGIFATRSPHRPNPIGLSLAKLEKIEGDTIFLSGIDLVNGTPVLDVKPYLPLWDGAENARTGWAEENVFPELEVEFTEKAEEDIKETGDVSLRSLISDTLRQDPRNRRDRSQMGENHELGFFISNHDIHFSVRGGKATVISVETGKTFVKKFRRGKNSLKDSK